MSNPHPNYIEQLEEILKENSTHYERVCLNCGEVWLGLHCPHDGYQNSCPYCDERPEEVIDNTKGYSCGCNGVTDIGEATPQILKLIENITNEALPEPEDMRPEITEWLISEDYSKGYNQAITDTTNNLKSILGGGKND